MADEIGLRVRLKMAVDRSEAERAARETERVLKEKLHEATKLKLGGIEVPKFVQDLRETLSAGPLSARGLTSESGLANIFGRGSEGLIGKMAGIFIIIESVRDILKDSLDRLTEASPALRNIQTQMSMAINQILRPMGDAVASLLRPIAKSMHEYARKSSQIERNITSEYGEAAGMFAGIGLAFAGIVGPLVITIGKAVVDFILWPFRQIYDALKKVSDMMDDFNKWASDKIKAGLEPLTKFGTWLYEELKKLFTFDERDLKRFTGGIGEALGSLIPKFAAGGVVDRPTLAVVGERGREWIVPETGLAVSSTGPAWASGGITIVINGNIYGDIDLQRTIRTELDNYYRAVISR